MHIPQVLLIVKFIAFNSEALPHAWICWDQVLIKVPVGRDAQHPALALQPEECWFLSFIKGMFCPTAP